MQISTLHVAHGKPAPDVFLAAAAQLGVDPANCVVIEDAVPGLQAAHAAGMRAIAIPSVTDPLDPEFTKAELLVAGGMSTADSGGGYWPGSPPCGPLSGRSGARPRYWQASGLTRRTRCLTPPTARTIWSSSGPRDSPVA
ncbi:MAG: HAD family hydrolase [Candidatus Nanopelagicales bacterium]